MKKKLLLASCLLGLAFGLVACGNNATDDVSSSIDNEVVEEMTDDITDVEEEEVPEGTTEENTAETKDETEPIELTHAEEMAIGHNDSSLNLSDEEYLNAVRFIKYVVGDEIGPDNQFCYKYLGKYIVYVLSAGEYKSVEAMINDVGATGAFDYHTEFDSIATDMTEGMLSSDEPEIVAYTVVEASGADEIRGNAEQYNSLGTIYNIFEIGSSSGRFMVFFTE